MPVIVTLAGTPSTVAESAVTEMLSPDAKPVTGGAVHRDPVGSVVAVHHREQIARHELDRFTRGQHLIVASPAAIAAMIAGYASSWGFAEIWFSGSGSGTGASSTITGNVM